jgi:outer membrane protein, adhesin transport system
VQVRAETSRFAQFFAEFKLLAAQNALLRAMQVEPPKAAMATARTRFKVQPTQPLDSELLRDPR